MWANAQGDGRPLALPNIGGTLCSMLQSLAHYLTAVQ